MSRSDRRSGRVESAPGFCLQDGTEQSAKAKDFSRNTRGGSRLSARRLAELAEQLTDRDRLVLSELARLRLLSGGQLERLSFTGIADSARGRVRRRVLGRLVGLGLVVTLERRVGGVRAGSAGLVYALSGAGWRLMDQLSRVPESVRRRTRQTPGTMFLAHTLSVSEIYVDLTERLRGSSGIKLEAFDVEADARWTDADGEVLRPDALVAVSAGGIEDVWWLEADRGTESLARIRWMLKGYLQFAHEATTGPRGVIPRILVTVLDQERQSDIRNLIRRLNAPDGLLQVVLQPDAGRFLVAELLGADQLTAHEREPP